MKKYNCSHKVKKDCGYLLPGFIRISMLASVLMAFFLTTAWFSLPQGSLQEPVKNSPTPTPIPVISATSTATATPLPLELLTNKDQTIGIALGGVTLVLIILGGTLGTIIRRKRH